MKTISRIPAIAEALLHDHDLFARPVDVEKLATAMNIEVQRKPLDDDISGFLVVKNGSANIFLNSLHHHNRQRFTLAHEIGHFKLHHVDAAMTESLYVDRHFYRGKMEGDSDSQKKEYEADDFAAALLMPASLVRMYAKQAGIHIAPGKEPNELDVYRLAAAFVVSEKAMEICCERMGKE